MLYSNSLQVLFLLLVSIQVAHGWVISELKRKISGIWNPSDAKPNGPFVDGCNLCVWGACSPAIQPLPVIEFHPTTDSDNLKAALFNDKAIINAKSVTSIMTQRSESQRQEIIRTFEANTKGAKLTNTILHLFRGRYGHLMVALARPLQVFYARRFRSAIEGEKKSVNKLNNMYRISMVEMFTTLSPCFIQRIKRAYNKLHGTGSFTNDIQAILTGHFPQSDYIDVLISLAKAERDGTTGRSWWRAWRDAKRMKAAIERDDYNMKKVVFKQVFTQRNIPQLQETARMYEVLRRGEVGFESLAADIKLHMGTASEIYRTMAIIVKNQPLYYAALLKKHFKASQAQPQKTDDDKFISLIRARCDIDLGDVKAAYKDMYKKDLITEFNSRGTPSGDYYNAMQKILK